MNSQPSYKELQKFIMLPSPVDRQTLFRMLRHDSPPPYLQ